MFATWQVGQVVWSILWFTLFFMWIWLVISIFADILRSPDMGGWAKAAWTIFVVFLPFLGVLIYLIARGHKMNEHTLQQRTSAGRGNPRLHPECGGLAHVGRRDREGSATPRQRSDHRRGVPGAQGEGALVRALPI